MNCLQQARMAALEWALANGETPYLRVFVTSFERDDAQRCAHAHGKR